MNSAYRSLLRAGAGTAYRGKVGTSLPILMYHRVLASADPLLPGVTYASEFRAQLKILREVFTVLPLDESVELLQSGRLPPRAACITFDDGYRDNHDVALPLLREHGLTATFFVSTGFLDGGRMFNDTIVETIRRLPSMELDLARWGIGRCTVSGTISRVAAAERITRVVKYMAPASRDAFCEEFASFIDDPLPDDLMLTSEQLRAMRQHGMTIGGHTSSHPILENVDAPTAQREIEDNRERIKSTVGTAPRCFAYPNGKPTLDYSAGHVEMVRKAGYACAVSTAWGVAAPAIDRFQLPRFMPRDRTPARFVARMIGMSRHSSPALV